MSETVQSQNIYKKISLIMQEISFVQKREKGKGMVYDFVSHDDVSELIHEPLARHGIVVLPDVVDFRIDGNQHFVTVKVTLVNADNPEDRFCLTAHGFSIDAQDKGYGKALTYALKYVYLKLFVLQSGLADEIDAHQIDVPAKLNAVTAQPNAVKTTDTPSEYVLTWGAHKGKTISQLPKDYIEYMKREGHLDKPAAIEFVEALKKAGRL